MGHERKEAAAYLEFGARKTRRVSIRRYSALDSMLLFLKSLKLSRTADRAGGFRGALAVRLFCESVLVADD